jgi:hypothetical protein
MGASPLNGGQRAVTLGDGQRCPAVWCASLGGQAVVARESSRLGTTHFRFHAGIRATYVLTTIFIGGNGVPEILQFHSGFIFAHRSFAKKRDIKPNRLRWLVAVTQHGCARESAMMLRVGLILYFVFLFQIDSFPMRAS